MVIEPSESTTALRASDDGEHARPSGTLAAGTVMIAAVNTMGMAACNPDAEADITVIEVRYRDRNARAVVGIAATTLRRQRFRFSLGCQWIGR